MPKYKFIFIVQWEGGKYFIEADDFLFNEAQHLCFYDSEKTTIASFPASKTAILKIKEIE